MACNEKHLRRHSPPLSATFIEYWLALTAAFPAIFCRFSFFKYSIGYVLLILFSYLFLPAILSRWYMCMPLLFRTLQIYLPILARVSALSCVHRFHYIALVRFIDLPSLLYSLICALMCVSIGRDMNVWTCLQRKNNFNV